MLLYALQSTFDSLGIITSVQLTLTILLSFLLFYIHTMITLITLPSITQHHMYHGDAIKHTN